MSALLLSPPWLTDCLLIAPASPATFPELTSPMESREEEQRKGESSSGAK